jgi:RimJ/RimL family protein N-acetyltransferase
MAALLETPRLILRPWAESDLDDYRELIAERGDGIPSLATVREKIAAQHAQAENAGIALLPIRRREDGTFIGYCGLTIGRATLEEPEIAYELLRRQWGNGYATEAAEAVIAAARATGRTRLWATIRTWNARSLRVIEKLGFQRDSITADDRGDLAWMTRALG